jgi:thiaminase/transcriptional activator TenA
VATYANPSFAALADRCAEMLDEAHRADLVDEATATATFEESMRHELAFWDVP